MAYATKQDIIDRYGVEILAVASDRDRDLVEDTSVVASALDDATGEIDAWIAAKYDLPLPSVPAHLVLCCVDIAIYRLHVTHDILTDERRQRYEDCVALLRAIAKGDASLGLDDPPASIGGDAYLSAGDRLFTRTTMQGL
jgi:phage gp36-like protein